MIRPLLSILTVFCLFSCKNNHPAAPETTENVAPVAETVIPAEDAAPQREPVQPDTFRVVISFISMGEGTDPEGPAKVERILKSWERRKGTPPSYTVQPWGREGEADYNFTLRGLTPSDQVEFVKQLQSALKDEKLIIVTENKANRFKR